MDHSTYERRGLKHGDDNCEEDKEEEEEEAAARLRGAVSIRVAAERADRLRMAFKDWDNIINKWSSKIELDNNA